MNDVGNEQSKNVGLEIVQKSSLQIMIFWHDKLIHIGRAEFIVNL